MHIGIAGPILTDSLKNYLELPKNYPKGLGGSNVNNLIIGLLKLGHKVSIYTLDVDVREPKVLNGKQLKVYFGEYRKRARHRMQDFFRKESQQIKEFIQTDKPEIVNAHWGYEFAIGTIKSGYPHIITLHDVPMEILKLQKDLYRVVRLLMNYWVMKNGKYFCANSPYTADKLKKFSKDIPVIPNSILSEWIVDKPKEFPNEKTKIISLLSGWGEIKNPQPAIKAFSMLRKKYKDKIEYHLYGSGYEKFGIGYNWAKENDLLDGIYFHGPKPYWEIIELLPNYDILLHPAKEESFGMTLIEAMAKGLPVIAGKNSGAVQWVLNYGENGILVDVTSPDDIANGIERLINDKLLYEKLSLEGLKYVLSQFNDEKIAKQYINIYRNLL
ncbi:MAG: glycosyltransferase family 4 protein [Melioribacteraceae bacterium]